MTFYSIELAKLNQIEFLFFIFETITEHVEQITEKPPEHPESYFRRCITINNSHW
jgi:hypothetical protein